MNMNYTGFTIIVWIHGLVLPAKAVRVRMQRQQAKSGCVHISGSNLLGLNEWLPSATVTRIETLLAKLESTGNTTLDAPPREKLTAAPKGRAELPRLDKLFAWGEKKWLPLN
jgi:hypothetical protein